MKSLACVLLLPLLALSQTVEEVALKAEGKLRSVQSIQANFEQTLYSSPLFTPLRERGKFYFKKPDFMRWEYKEPEEKIFIYKESTFLIYYPEDKELIKSATSKEIYESEVLSLLSGKKSFLNDYVVEFCPFPSDDQNAWKLKLTPKEEDGYSSILLEINEKSWLIQKAIFFDWSGSKSEFHFSQIKTDLTFPQKLFELKLPADVEIFTDAPVKKSG
jgi:outer membrane lipoprotein carrier protein